MNAVPTAQTGLLAAAARRASVPTSNPSTDAATPFQAKPAARSSFVGGGMSYRHTVDERVQPPMQYQPAAMRVTGTLPHEQGIVSGEGFPHPAPVRRPSRAMPNLEATHQPAGTATYAVSSVGLEPSQEPLHQVGVYKESLMAPRTQDIFASYQMHEESMAQQSMPVYPAQLPADRRDSLAAAQSQQVVAGIAQVQAGRRGSVVAPQLHQSFVSTERMYEEMQSVHAVPQSAQVLASLREGVAPALVPQARQNTKSDERMTNDVYAVAQNQVDPQLQVQTSSRQSMTAPHVQQSLGNSAQTQAGSRGSFAAPQMQQHGLANSEHMQDRWTEIAAPQLQQSHVLSEHMQNHREEITGPQVQPQPRQSRLSRDAQPQGELLQTRAASLPPLAARSSHAAERRASAPTNALPNIAEEPPAMLAQSPAAGKLLSKVGALPHGVPFLAQCSSACTELVNMLGR